MKKSQFGKHLMVILDIYIVLMLTIGGQFVFVNKYLVNKRAISKPKRNPWTFFSSSEKHIMVLQGLKIVLLLTIEGQIFCKRVSHQQEGHFQSKVEFLNLF